MSAKETVSVTLDYFICLFKYHLFPLFKVLKEIFQFNEGLTFSFNRQSEIKNCFCLGEYC